jgi:hypothetical protein
LYELGHLLQHGICCDVDKERALQLFREAAELEYPMAQWAVGHGERDWQRFDWWARAASGGISSPLRDAVPRLLPLFGKGLLGRVLHTVAPTIRANIDPAKSAVLGRVMEPYGLWIFVRVVELHQAMLGRARAAVHCWGVAARRLGMARDMRVLIAKTVWAEPWHWSAREGGVGFEAWMRSLWSSLM